MIRCLLAICLLPGILSAAFAQDAPLPKERYVSPYLTSADKMMLLDTREAAKKAKPAHTFLVSDHVAPFVMGKAQAIISDWREKSGYQCVMKIQNVNDNFIDTYNPFKLGQYGLNVSLVKVPGGRQITIQGKGFEGNLFAISQEHKDADKRADLLAFLLQEYIKELESDPSQLEAVVAPAKKSNLKPEIEALLTGIRALLEAGQVDAAIAQMDILKALLQKPVPPAPTTPDAKTPKK